MRPRRDARRNGSGYVFTWWQDAVLYAERAAGRTGRRHQVRKAPAGRQLWVVCEVEL